MTGSAPGRAAEVTTGDGDHTSVAVNPSGAFRWGVGANSQNEPTTLLRLTVDG
jgi:hypothetical protein